MNPPKCYTWLESYFLNHIGRQNFANAFAETSNLNLQVCLMLIMILMLMIMVKKFLLRSRWNVPWKTWQTGWKWRLHRFSSSASLPHSCQKYTSWQSTIFNDAEIHIHWKWQTAVGNKFPFKFIIIWKRQHWSTFNNMWPELWAICGHNMRKIWNPILEDMEIWKYKG